jgi:rare lipoprotein A (peptidoglycan hydrolase)
MWNVPGVDIAIFSNSLCGQLVQITNTQNRKNVTVAIADECVTCQNAQSIDLSLGAFDAIADPEQGIVPSESFLLVLSTGLKNC